MDSTSHLFERYLFENLGIPALLSPWEKERLLPRFFQDLYRVYICQLLGHPSLVLAKQSDEEISPAKLEKHVRKVREFEPDANVVYLHTLISTFNRKRLIERKIAFVVPGKQMYLPFLGVDLREFLRKRQMEKPTRFKPSTQAVFLAVLYSRPGDVITSSMLAEKLKYSRMTMSRALDEIEAVGLVTVFSKGRNRVLRVPESREHLLTEGLLYLISPVKKRLKISGGISLTGLVPSGETALCTYAMLSESVHPVYAVSPETWKNKEQTENPEFLSVHEGDSMEIEVWKYSPDLFARKNAVDPLSLYLSLKHVQDERVEIALDYLLKESLW